MQSGSLVDRTGARPTPEHASPVPPMMDSADELRPDPPALLGMPMEPGPEDRNAFAQMINDIRHSRGRDVSNSRPVPSWVQRLAWSLDSAFKIPGTDNRRVGFDGFLTLIPGVGDAIGATLSFTVILAAIAAGVSIPTLLRMLLNVGIESVAGIVPFGGAVFDMIFKANMRNVVLMERDLADRMATRRSSIAVLALSALFILIGLVAIVVLFVAAIALIVWLGSKVL